MTRPDPMRSLRSVFAGTLVMEAIVVGLALLVVGRVGDVSSSAGRWYTGALALALVLASGLQRRSWGLALALVLQLAVVAGWFAHPALGVVGLVFCVVWGFFLYFRRAVAQRMAEEAPQ